MTFHLCYSKDNKINVPRNFRYICVLLYNPRVLSNAREDTNNLPNELYANMQSQRSALWSWNMSVKGIETPFTNSPSFSPTHLHTHKKWTFRSSSLSLSLFHTRNFAEHSCNMNANRNLFAQSNICGNKLMTEFASINNTPIN